MSLLGKIDLEFRIDNFYTEIIITMNRYFIEKSNNSHRDFERTYKKDDVLKQTS